MVDGNGQTSGSQVTEITNTRRFGWRGDLLADVSRWLNRGMPEDVTIGVQVWWPLVLIPIVLVNQLLAPHAVWMALLITLTGVYAVGYAWVRHQAPLVMALRERVGAILVAGDTLREDFEVRNHSRVPLMWAEFADDSDVPHYQPGRVVACGAFSFYRWRAEVVCERRGVFRLGPYRVRFGDPFGIFSVELRNLAVEALLIYPRVAKLPALRLPHGNSGGSDRRRRPVRGTLPSATVSDYRPGDSLRHIHWRTSARQSRLMVKDLEIEPSGDVWIVLDLNRQVHTTGGPASTLEYAVTVAASLAAELLSGGDRRAVGLLAASAPRCAPRGFPDPGADAATVHVEPLPGQAQLWTILSALASVQEANVTLDELLHSSRELLGRRRTLVVITPQTERGQGRMRVSSEKGANGQTEIIGSVPEWNNIHSEGAGDADGERGIPGWVAELVHLRSLGLDSSVLLVTPGEDSQHTEGSQAVENLRGLLAAYDISCQELNSGRRLPSVLTFRRTRRVIRSTPTGGVVSYEVEEEVG